MDKDIILMTKSENTMHSKILDGKKVSNQIINKLSLKIIDRKNKNIPPPCLAVIIVGNDPASKIYVNNKKVYSEKIGIKSLSYDLQENTTTNELLSLIMKLNNNKDVNGILVQLPLPNHINANLVLEKILPEKDVDGFHPYNVGRLSQNNPQIRSCTPYGIIKLLEHYKINLEGKNTVIIGESNIVGRPLISELLNKNATVTICHKHTNNLEKHVKYADIIFTATGVANLIKGDWIKQDAVVVDVGICRLDNEQIVGDVEFEKAIKKASFITPVPGGVGPMTIAMLLKNTLLAQDIQLKKL